MVQSRNDFLIIDPLAQDGVVPEVPDGERIVDLDNVPYYAEPGVHCAFCKQRQWHKDGYFAILSNGQRAPCGNCCAANFDATKKKTIDRNRSRLKREREHRVRAHAVADGLPEIIALIDRDFVRRADAAEAELFTVRNVLVDVLEELSAVGVRGIDALRGCRGDVHKAKRQFEFVCSKAKCSDGLREADAAPLLRARGEALDELRQCLRFLRSAAEFYDDQNLAAIEEWAAVQGRRFGIVEFRRKGMKLHLKGGPYSIFQNVDVVVMTVPERLDALIEDRAAIPGE